jgi:hypothetical protein
MYKHLFSKGTLEIKKIINGNVSFGGLILVTIFLPTHFFNGHPFAPILLWPLKKKKSQIRGMG